MAKVRRPERVERPAGDTLTHWREHVARDHPNVGGCDQCAERAHWWAGMQARTWSPQTPDGPE